MALSEIFVNKSTEFYVINGEGSDVDAVWITSNNWCYLSQLFSMPVY